MTTISQIGVTASSISDNDLSEIEQGGVSKKVTESVKKAYYMSDVTASPLTGLSTSTATVITATDTVLSAAGKLQAQITAIPAPTSGGGGVTSDANHNTKVGAGALVTSYNVGGYNYSIGGFTSDSAASACSLYNVAVYLPVGSSDYGVYSEDGTSFRCDFRDRNGYQNTPTGTKTPDTSVPFSNSTGLGYNAQVTGSNQVQLGDSATTTYVYGTVANRSDVRDKAEVRDTILGLDFIKSLRPVDYKWDMREDYRTPAPKVPDLLAPSSPVEPVKPLDETLGNYQELLSAYKVALKKYTDEGVTYQELLVPYNAAMDAYKVEKAAWLESVKLSNLVHDGSKMRNRYHHGFIAQEVLALGGDFGGIQDHTLKGGDAVLTLGYDEIIAPLVKAIQEQQVMIDKLMAQIVPQS